MANDCYEVAKQFALDAVSSDSALADIIQRVAAAAQHPRRDTERLDVSTL
jgi:hypothetical protein